jgi:predicted  nucleic acid-binding Zn-ribbon protein
MPERPQGPVSFPDLVRALNDHIEEDRETAEAMKKAFANLESQNETQLAEMSALNKKQDEQLDTLGALLKHSDYQSKQAEASGVERGKRQAMEKVAQAEKERAEKRERQWKWRWRFVIVPLIVLVAHFATKWWFH